MIYCIAALAALTFGSVCYGIGKYHARRQHDYARQIINALNAMAFDELARRNPQAAAEIQADLTSAFTR